MASATSKKKAKTQLIAVLVAIVVVIAAVIGVTLVRNAHAGSDKVVTHKHYLVRYNGRCNVASCVIAHNYLSPPPGQYRAAKRGLMMSLPCRIRQMCV